MKTRILLFLFSFSIGLCGCKIAKFPIVKNDSVSSEWKTYSNNNLGIYFQYPSTWTKYGEESNTTNRNGDVMSINVNFIDTITHSNFYLEYHLAPYGDKLYKFAQEQFNSSQGWYANEGAKQIEVAGNKAIESFNTMNSDIKGNIYDPPLKFVRIIFLDKLQTGEFDLQFKTLSPVSVVEMSKFNQLLSTIQFTN